MDQTQNYNLIKPTDDDFYDVADANHNMDIIDEELKKANEKQGNLALLQTQEKSSLVGAVNEVSSHMAQKVSKEGDVIDGLLTVRRLNSSVSLELERYDTAPSLVKLGCASASGNDELRIFNKNTELMLDVRYADGTMSVRKEGDATRRLVAMQVTPTETVITSGFAAGWSGTLGFRKTQEGIVIVNISQLLKTSNINTSNEVVYTLPSGFRPTRTVKTANVGVSDASGAVAGSMVELIIEAGTGSVILRSSGSITANVRQITGTQISGV